MISYNVSLFKRKSFFLLLNALHYVVLFCVALRAVALNSLHSVALRCTSLRCVVLYCATLCCIALRYVALHCVALRRSILRCVILNYAAHYQERPTPILSLCHGIFTDRFIFRLFVK